MTLRPFSFLFPCAVVGLLSMSGAVQAAEALKVELVPKAQKGQGQPELVVKAQAELTELVLDVKRASDGKRIRQKAGPVFAGREHRFELPMKDVGRSAFVGELSVKMADGQSGAMPIQVDAELVEQLAITIAPQDVALVERRMRLSANRELAKVQVSLMSDTGTPLGTTELEVGAPDADGKVAVVWEQKKGTVMRMSVKGWDESGFFGGVDLFPWKVDIPHEEVNFRSGSFDVDATETSKLESSFEQIKRAIDRYGKLATIRLFIAGHTDTVGDAASNRTLSNNRARAIGRWFAKRGVKIPISYAGFGEDVLAVKTPDETDEGQNRRAEYIVAVDPPPIPGDAVRWRPLD